MTQLNLATWDNLLRKYVNDQGQIAYDSWKQNSLAELEQWLTNVRNVDLQGLDRQQAIAFLLNLYNALTIRQVLHQYPIDSIRPQVLGIPNWLTFLRFFTQTIFTLNGQSLSLNTIEHKILRQQYPEPRIHFALVCASVGCPLLRAEAYIPDRLTAQLEDDCERFINNPDKVRYDAASQTLYCSKIFKWYKTDFLTVADSMPTYIGRYFKDPLPPDVTLVYLPYSWDLNQCLSS
ncbi:DUF547 domain-containing protein [Acaryochloris marina]|uniref:DUF547 domain-containing protein n=1 Tax=Acaryochloris marina (strain MBIC 11017) TaxID=329726 RepID=B0C5W6_ACAM1|nr:DUF547 domain-containing protein [Acaryochloris marina]ABW29978.1 conserved hypothetical protein [Acaryochloris marina MBIC11017]